MKTKNTKKVRLHLGTILMALAIGVLAPTAALADKGGHDNNQAQAASTSSPSSVSDNHGNGNGNSGKGDEGTKGSDNGKTAQAAGGQDNGNKGQGQSGDGKGNDGNGSTHVTICHATGTPDNAGNGYVMISPSASGVYHGHYSQHDADIIPPFQYKGQTYSKNWTTQGQAIFNNGCKSLATGSAAGGQDKGKVQGQDNDNDNDKGQVNDKDSDDNDNSGKVSGEANGSTHVTICHATGTPDNAGNGYVMISPSTSGVYHGHYRQHDADIIPPFQYKGQTYSKNWTTQGQAVFNNGCKTPAAGAGTPAPVPGDTTVVTQTPAPSGNGTVASAGSAPSSVPVGQTASVTVKAAPGTTVTAEGAGVSVSKVAGSSGKVTIKVTPKKAGVIVVKAAHGRPVKTIGAVKGASGAALTG